MLEVRDRRTVSHLSFNSKGHKSSGFYLFQYQFIHVDFHDGSDGKASAHNAGDPGSIPGLGRSPGEGNGNPLQYSCLENPMDGRAWQATVHVVTKSRTQLSDSTFHFPWHLGTFSVHLFIYLFILCLLSLPCVRHWDGLPSSGRLAWACSHSRESDAVQGLLGVWTWD